jgi:hypothetical protein
VTIQAISLVRRFSGCRGRIDCCWSGLSLRRVGDFRPSTARIVLTMRAVVFI